MIVKFSVIGATVVPPKKEAIVEEFGGMRYGLELGLKGDTQQLGGLEIGAQLKGVLDEYCLGTGPGLIDGVNMEGVKVDLEDVVIYVELDDGTSGVMVNKIGDLNKKNVRKWKRAARAWSKHQILGKALSPLQMMLVVSNKINKVSRRNSLSSGQRFPISRSNSLSSPKAGVKILSQQGSLGVVGHGVV
ncbi:hypothetical protein ACOSQ4_027734 [Xanthoceras sorbifolium]